MDFVTSKERLDHLDEKVSKILKHLEPETKNEESKISEILNDFAEKFESKIDNTISKLNKEVRTSELIIDEMDYSKFNLERIYSFVGAAIFFLLMTLWAYNGKSILFLLPAGFFVATLGILFLIFIDWKLTPGDSFARISKNPVAIAITLFVIALFFYVGVEIGQRYIPDSFGNEASQRIETRLDNIENSIKEKQVSPTPDNTDEETGDKGIPNR